MRLSKQIIKILINKIINKSKVGFTLVETLIYIALLGMVVTSFVFFALNISGNRTKTYVVQEVQANARTGLSLLTKTIRAANGVNNNDSVWQSDPGVLSLSMADPNLDPTVFSLNADNGQLQIKEGTQATTTITSPEVLITNLVFTDLTATSTKNNIKIDMTFSYNNPANDQDFADVFSLQTAVSTRL